MTTFSLNFSHNQKLSKNFVMKKTSVFLARDLKSLKLCRWEFETKIRAGTGFPNLAQSPGLDEKFAVNKPNTQNYPGLTGLERK